MILNEQNPWLMDDQIICRMATTVMMRGGWWGKKSGSGCGGAGENRDGGL